MTKAKLEMKLRKLDHQIAAIELRKKPIKKQIEKIELDERLRAMTFKAGDKVEYRLNGQVRVYFGVVKAINARNSWRITYLVERIDEKTGEATGFGNEVMESEIFGCSIK